jgi:hypothetical protein
LAAWAENADDGIPSVAIVDDVLALGRSVFVVYVPRAQVQVVPRFCAAMRLLVAINVGDDGEIRNLPDVVAKPGVVRFVAIVFPVDWVPIEYTAGFATSGDDTAPVNAAT